MNQPESGIPQSETEIEEPKPRRRKEKVPTWTPQEIALTLGYKKMPHEKGDPVQKYCKVVENGHVYRFNIQNSKYSDERGVRISMGIVGSPKNVVLCQDRRFDEDMKDLGLVTRTSAGMFWRPELQTKEVFEKLTQYIRNLEETGFFEDLIEPR